MKKFLFLLAFISITISYSSGQVFQEWVQRFNGTDSLTDRAFAIDVKGHIYVTGTSYNSGTPDFTTLKYNSNGQLLWSRIITGISPGGGIPRGIVVDNLCNVYVTGTNGGIFTTVKYDSAGVQKWVTTYSGAGATISNMAKSIGIDKNGNVYISGMSVELGSALDYTTIKYDNNGVEQWIVHFNGAANLYDVASGSFVDTNGNVYVNGRSQKADETYDIVTIKYDSLGTALWQSTIPDSMQSGFLGTAAARVMRVDPITVDKNGNVYIGSTAGGKIFASELDFLTAKYSSSGNLLWKTRYNGPGNDQDIIKGIAIDNSGNVFVTGGSKGIGTDFDYATIKYNANGITRWLNRFDGPASSEDVTLGIALDTKNNVYVTGASTGVTSSSDYITIKYDASGQLAWTQRYNGPANGYDAAVGVKLDAGNNVYVTGFSQGIGTNFDFATIKYNQELGKQIQSVMEGVKTVAMGLLGVSKNPAVRNLVYDNITLGELDSAYKYFFISLPDLIQKASAIGINLKDSINRTINKINGTNPNRDNLTKILNGMNFRGTRLNPHIFIPHLDSFDSTVLTSQNPFIGYGFLENDYPLNGFSEISNNQPIGKSIIKDDVKNTPTWLVFPSLPDAPIFNGEPPIALIECFLTQNFCNACNSIFPIDGIPTTSNFSTTTGCIGSYQSYEMKLQIKPDGCLDGLMWNMWAPLENYAVLSTLPGQEYWDILIQNTIESGLQSAKKITTPPIRKYNYKNIGPVYGDILVLCNSCNKFDMWSSQNSNTVTVTGALAHNTIFQLKRPNQLPLYFVLPYAQGLWFGSTTDGITYFGTKPLTGTCPPINLQKIIEDYQYPSSNGYLNNAFNCGANCTDFLASTDRNTIENFWKSNTIVVGVGPAGGPLAHPMDTNAVLTFTPGTSTGPPPQITPIQKLELNFAGEYMVRRNFPSTILQGTTLTVYVQARFKNGTFIDEYKTVIASTNCNSISVDIRGMIKDFDNTIDNYLINIY